VAAWSKYEAAQPLALLWLQSRTLAWAKMPTMFQNCRRSYWDIEAGTLRDRGTFARWSYCVTSLCVKSPLLGG